MKKMLASLKAICFDGVIFAAEYMDNTVLVFVTCNEIQGGKYIIYYSKCSKILNTFLFLFSNTKYWLSGLDFIKCLVE